jgi:hypothetical protein
LLSPAAMLGFPYRVECGACGFTTDFVKLPGVAAKLWDEAKGKMPQPEPGKMRRR